MVSTLAAEMYCTNICISQSCQIPARVHGYCTFRADTLPVLCFEGALDASARSMPTRSTTSMLEFRFEGTIKGKQHSIEDPTWPSQQPHKSKLYVAQL